MENFGKYFRVQIKRAAKSLPAVLFPALLLMGIAVLLGRMIWSISEGSADKQKVQIALVGDLSDPYLKLGMYALENLDSIHFTVEFLPMAEEEAQRELDLGRITAYARIPEGLVESIMWGENKKVTYVTSGNSGEMVSVLIRELMETVSTLLVESQNSVYGIQRFLENHGLEDRMWEATEEINLRYFDLFLNRTELYKMEFTGISNELSLPGYYLCAMMVLFLMLWGIAACPLFVKGDLAFQKLLRARGQSLWAQVMGEYAACLFLMLASFLIIGGILLAGIRYLQVPIPEWEGASQEEQLVFLLQAVPVAALMAAFQMLLFELVSGIVSGVLLQFISTVCLGYVSGCFYPVSFLPEGMRRASAFLPSGISIRYLDGCMLGNGGSPGELLWIILSLLLFLGLTMLVRGRRLRAA